MELENMENLKKLKASVLELKKCENPLNEAQTKDIFIFKQQLLREKYKILEDIDDSFLQAEVHIQ